jgi:hypothetical protein
MSREFKAGQIVCLAHEVQLPDAEITMMTVIQADYSPAVPAVEASEGVEAQPAQPAECVAVMTVWFGENRKLESSRLPPTALHILEDQTVEEREAEAQ